MSGKWPNLVLNPGGVVLVFDWKPFGCRAGIDNYRERHHITDPIEVKAGNGFWIKS